MRTTRRGKPDEARPGFEHNIIKPYVPDSLTFVRVSTQTVRGRVAVEWKKQGGELVLNLVISVNCTATVYVPSASASRVESKPPLIPSGCRPVIVPLLVRTSFREFPPHAGTGFSPRFFGAKLETCADGQLRVSDQLLPSSLFRS